MLNQNNLAHIFGVGMLSMGDNNDVSITNGRVVHNG